MKDAGIIPGRLKERITLRLRSLDPYSSEMTAGQLGIIAEIAERYGSGKVHVTPRQTIEIPDIEYSYIEEIKSKLHIFGLYTGSANKLLRNVIACSRWCLYNAYPMSELALRINRLLKNKVFPGKTNISLSGCDFSCVRSRTSDIGVIARADIELTDVECKQCSLCFKEPLGCQVDAITITDEGASIDRERCIRCGFWTHVCKPGSVKVSSISFDLFIGGCGGIKPQEGHLFDNYNSEDELLEGIEAVLNKYLELGKDGERIGRLFERLALEAGEE